MRPPVRIKDIAEKLGVSEVTVSLALRDHPRISLKRRDQVKATAKAMDYHPNAMASALAHRKWTLSPHAVTNTLAWINAWPEPSQLRSFYEFNAYWTGAFNEAEKRGYHLEEFVLDPSLSPLRLQKILSTRNIRGLLIPPQKETNKLHEIDYSSFAVIRFGRSVAYPPVSLVSHSQAIDADIAMQQILAMGYQRIGYITSANFQRSTMFDAGYLKNQANLKLRDPLPILVLEDQPKNTEPVLEKIRNWMKRNRPDAILTTEGNMKALLKSAGYEIPHDVALAATSVSDCDADAGIFQNPEEIGRVAAITLIGLVQSSSFGIPDYHHDILVRGKWQNGNTLPEKKKSES